MIFSSFDKLTDTQIWWFMCLAVYVNPGWSEKFQIAKIRSDMKTNSLYEQKYKELNKQVK